MTRFVMLLFSVISAGTAWAISADAKLLSLVPPGAEIVAGITAPRSPDQPDSFVLTTHNNTVDLEDFYALTGADSTRIIHQIVFVAMTDGNGQLSEHSLLVYGHFDQPHLFKSAADGGATATSYHRIPVLEIAPFARERGTFNDARWLAVLDSSVLIFGSISNTRLELDRYLARSQPDASLLRRLARLRSNQQTWCILSSSVRTLSSPALDQQIRSVLSTLNPELAELSQLGDEFEFGVHYGRHVEFEYDVTMASTQENRSDQASHLPSPLEPAKNALLPELNTVSNAHRLHGVIVVPVLRYNRWLDEIRRARSPLN